MAADELFTREEVLGGLPARRAANLLFLIESRTAHMVAQSRQAMELFLSDDAARDRDLAFLEAFALGRAPPLRPNGQVVLPLPKEACWVQITMVESTTA